MTAYHYTECGLDNVFIEGLRPVMDDEGEEVICIPHVRSLHRAIAEGILMHEKGMSNDELRFLRTEMGMTQAELAKIVHVERVTISRWESGEFDIDAKAEALIRLHASDRLKIPLPASVEQISAWCVPTTDAQEIRIDGTMPGIYRKFAA